MHMVWMSWSYSIRAKVSECGAGLGPIEPPINQCHSMKRDVLITDDS